MKGWKRIDNMVQHPIEPCPGNQEDYYWDYPNKKWVYIEDDMDMTWLHDRAYGYDVGPGERLRKESKTITGKEHKMLGRTKLSGDTWEELVADAMKKAKEIEEKCKK